MPMPQMLHNTRPIRPACGDSANANSAQRQVPIGDLLTPGFLRRNSNFRDVQEWVLASGLDPCRLSNLDAQTQQRWDDYARLSTRFPDWATLLREARGEWVMRRIGIFVDT